ncbi:hypothetical protein [Cognaticolwellia mytili]|uniref:hypothetical protein n=1 Tax=Cognaticolwellia mytili TaxID=1888913 RepID=UPI000A16CF95|nr:hypothetical protein [Cognaticolwellia mytili]
MKIYHKAVLSAVGFCLYANLSSISFAQSLEPTIPTAAPENILLESALAIQANLTPEPELDIENDFDRGQISGVNRVQTIVTLRQIIAMGAKRQGQFELVSSKDPYSPREYIN